MNLGVLMNFFTSDPRCLQIAESIVLPHPQQIHLAGTYGSVSQFILAAVAESATTAQNHLVIVKEAEDAAYFQNSLHFGNTNVMRILYSVQYEYDS